MNKYLLTVRIAFKGQHGQVAMEINPEVHSDKASRNKLAKEATRILCELNEWKAEDFSNWDSIYEGTIKSMKKQIMDFPLSTDFHGDKMIMVEPSQKRIKKTVTVNTRTNQGLLPVEMEEYKTKIESLKKYRLYCHKKPNGVWVLTEASTGVMIIDSLDNKKGLEIRLADYEEKILARIEEMLKEYHIAYGNANPEIVPADEIYVESEEEKEIKRAERAERIAKRKSEKEAQAKEEVKESEEEFEVGELPQKIRELSNKEVFNLAKNNGLMDELNNDTVNNLKNSWVKYLFIVEDKEKRSIEKSFARFANYFEEWKIKKFGTTDVDKIVSELDSQPAPADEKVKNKKVDNKMKARTKLVYNCEKREEFNYGLSSWYTHYDRSYDMFVTASTKEECEAIMENFEDAIRAEGIQDTFDSNLEPEYDKKKKAWVGAVEVYVGNDWVADEKDAIKEAYRVWKLYLKNPVPFKAPEEEASSAPEVTEEIKEAVVSCEKNGGNKCEECSFDGCNKESYELILSKVEAPAPEAPVKEKRKVKKIGGAIYIHRSNVDSLDEAEFELIWNRLHTLAESDYPCNSYEVIKIKDDVVSFIEVEGWDELREPIVGNSYAVKPDGSIKLTKKREQNPQIYHHKWMFVSDDYSGFDVEKEKAWSAKWQSVVPKGLSSSLGSIDNWEKFLKEYGLDK